MLEWNDSMSVGNDQVDTQHKTLLALFNDVESAAGAGAGKDEMLRHLNRLCDYVVEHFATEEALMDPETYPEYDRHMSEHMDCTTKALDFLQAYQQDQGVDAGAFLDLLRDWIPTHVLGTDQTLGRFLAARG